MHKKIKFKKHIMFKRIVFFILLLLSFYIIYNFSTQNGEISSSISAKVTEIIIELISKLRNMDTGTKIYYIEKLHPIIRKLAHFSVYTVVGFCAMGFMCTFEITNILKIIVSFSVGIIYAITDEIHQSFVPGRVQNIMDVLIDGAGVLSGIFILIIGIISVEAIGNYRKKLKI